MKKKLFLLPFLLITWILNSGFLFKPNIKVVTCGDEDYIANITLKDEKEILKNQPWIFDSKSGQIYAYDHKNNTLKPIKKEIYRDDEIEIETTYINNYVRENKLYLDFLERDLIYNPEEEVEVKAILDFNNMELTYYEGDVDFNNMELRYFTGDGPGENVCREITLPKNFQILK